MCLCIFLCVSKQKLNTYFHILHYIWRENDVIELRYSSGSYRMSRSLHIYICRICVPYRWNFPKILNVEFQTQHAEMASQKSL